MSILWTLKRFTEPDHRRKAADVLAEQERPRRALGGDPPPSARGLPCRRCGRRHPPALDDRHCAPPPADDDA